MQALQYAAQAQLPACVCLRGSQRSSGSRTALPFQQKILVNGVPGLRLAPHRSSRRRLCAASNQPEIVDVTDKLRALAAQAQSGSEGALAEEPSVEEKKSAALHDFCLGIPYGMLLGVGALISALVSKSLQPLVVGLPLAGVVTGLNVVSLQTWKKGGSSTPFTLASAAAAIGIGGWEISRYLKTSALFPSLAVFLLSLGMAGFFIYNMVAGGNPKSKKKSA